MCVTVSAHLCVSIVQYMLVHVLSTDLTWSVLISLVTL